jgi:hypothetical protein
MPLNVIDGSLTTLLRINGSSTTLRPAHRDKDARDTIDERRMDQCVRARAPRRPSSDLARAAHDHSPLGAACPEPDLGGEHGEVTPASRTFRVPVGTRWD